MRPVTEKQWQDAADSAEVLARLTTARVLLFLELGRLFGLVDESGEVDARACRETLEDAKEQGITPSASVIRMFVADSGWRE